MSTENKVIEWLEDRFGKVENIGNMLGFFEVAETIYENIPELLPMSRWQALKLLFSPKPQISLDEMVEVTLGKIRDLHDRKKLTTIKYEIEFESRQDIKHFYEDCKKHYHEIACIEERSINTLWLYTYVDFDKQLSDILDGVYDCVVNKFN